MRTIADIIKSIPSPHSQRLPAPVYTNQAKGDPVGFAVASMKDHTTDEGFQIFAALEHAGYKLVGRHFPRNETDVARALRSLDPHTVVLNDHREWDVQPRDFRDPGARFNRVDALADGRRFVLTLLKDSHQRPDYHCLAAQEIGCHSWIVYYHPSLVCHLAPYVRPEHLVRTYHTVDARLVPPYTAVGREGCLLSGAVSGVYPLRWRLFREAERLPQTTMLHHPGYHRQGCATPEYLQTLARYQVAICTASIYGYALRKLIEATAAGCVVVTDLPTDEVLPAIDANLVRLHPDTPTREVAELLRQLYARYDPERQRFFAEQACLEYDYHAMGVRLAQDIEAKRRAYAT